MGRRNRGGNCLADMSGWEGKKEDCMQVQEVEGERQKEMEIVHVCQEILKLLTAGMGVKGEQ